jgi:hypothetical protein
VVSDQVLLVARFINRFLPSSLPFSSFFSLLWWFWTVSLSTLVVFASFLWCILIFECGYWFHCLWIPFLPSAGSKFPPVFGFLTSPPTFHILVLTAPLATPTNPVPGISGVLQPPNLPVNGFSGTSAVPYLQTHQVNRFHLYPYLTNVQRLHGLRGAQAHSLLQIRVCFSWSPPAHSITAIAPVPQFWFL